MSSSRFDFGGKVALVTGVGRVGQIGNAVALAFGQAGAKIVACDLNAVGVATRVREFAAQGVDARPCAGDLTQPDIAALAVEMAIRHFGRLDVVVNVAGGLTTYGPLGRLAVADFDREIAINLKTTVLVSQAAIEALSRTRGCIINFASIAYFEPQKPMAVYSAAKYAVAGFTRSLAPSLAPEVRVNCLAPGWVRTAWGEAASADWQDRVRRETPLGVWGLPEDVAAAACWLASPAAGFITGQTIRVNGGAVR